MASSRNKSRKRGKRPTATIDLKAKDVSAQVDAGKVDASQDDAGKAGAGRVDARKAAPGASSPTTKRSTPDQSGPAKVQAQDRKSAGPAPKSAMASSTASTPSGRDTKSASAPAGSKTTGPAASAHASKAKPETPASRPTPKGGSAERKGSDGGQPGGGRSSSGLRSTVTHLAAGGLGGVLAMFGASQFAGQMPGTSTTSGTTPPAISGALETRLAALEKGFADSGTASPTVAIPDELKIRIAALESLDQKLDALTEGQTKLTSENGALSARIKELADPSGGGTVELRRRLDGMEGTISGLAKAAEGADNTAIPQLAALAGRMNDLRTEIEAKLTAAQKSAEGDISKRFGAIDETLQARARERAGNEEAIATLKAGNQRLSLALETARTEAGDLTTQLAAVKSASEQASGSLGGLQKTTSQLAARLDEIENTTAKNIAALPGQDDVSAAVAPVAEKLAAMETKIAAVLDREAGRANSAKQIVLALELTNLRRALDQGRPVTAEIKRIKSSAPDGLDLSPLDKLTTSKVPSREELVSEFKSVASDVVRAEAVDENASTFDKLFANARSIVRVRRTGDVQGDTTEAIVARAEDDLQRSDIKSAVLELKKLTGKAAGSVSSWMTKARDRLAIDAVLEQIEAGLKTSVASSATN